MRIKITLMTALLVSILLAINFYDFSYDSPSPPRTELEFSSYPKDEVRTVEKRLISGPSLKNENDTVKKTIPTQKRSERWKKKTREYKDRGIISEEKLAIADVRNIDVMIQEAASKGNFKKLSKLISVEINQKASLGDEVNYQKE